MCVKIIKGIKKNLHFYYASEKKNHESLNYWVGKNKISCVELTSTYI